MPPLLPAGSQQCRLRQPTMSNRTLASAMMGSVTTSSASAWTVIVPVKLTQLAKSRLAGFTPAVRQRLALAFALDTVSAAAASAAVSRVVVVTNDPNAERFENIGADIIPDRPDAGLNPALRHAATEVRRAGAITRLAAVSADLPCVRAGDLTRALTSAPAARWFVPDSHGTGTTMLAADAGSRWQPSFGEGSRDQHLALGMVEAQLEGIERLRRDVDTRADLRIARLLGVGAHTTRALDELVTVTAAATVDIATDEPA